MIDVVAIAVCLVFAGLALWHFYIALSPSTGDSGAVPSVGGKPLFVPSTGATLAVGIVLVTFAALATAGFLPLALPRRLLVWLSYGLSIGLLARGR